MKPCITTCHCGLDLFCPTPGSLHGEGSGNHWWSGWPGAYCMKCHQEDPRELCLADSCKCHCHDEVWELLEQQYELEEN